MPPLKATLVSIGEGGWTFAADAAVRAELVNDGDRPVAVFPAQLEVATFALEVIDSNDERVLLSSPPIPDERFTVPHAIEPGESLAIEYRGFLRARLPPGVYRVRFAFTLTDGDEPVTSDWLPLQLASEGPPPAPLAGPPPPAPKKPGLLGRLWNRLKALFSGPPRPFRPPRKKSFLRRLWNRLKGLFSWPRTAPLPPAPPAPPSAPPCTRLLEKEVSRTVTQTMSHAPAGQESWNGTTSDDANFRLTVDELLCTVTVHMRIRVSGTITPAQVAAWVAAIKAAWGGRYKLCCHTPCCPNGMVIEVDPEFVFSRSWSNHNVVTIVDDTKNAGEWSATDTVGITHEFGHLLGNNDEYNSVDGVNYGPGYKPNGSVMNNPRNPPDLRHYWLIRETVDELLGKTGGCATTAVGQHC